MNQFLYILILITLVDWFSYMSQRNVDFIYQGTIGSIIIPFLKLCATIGHFLCFYGFLLALFFKDGITWYSPLCLCGLAFLLNIVLTIFHAIMTAHRIVLAILFHVISVIGIFSIAILEIAYIIK